MIFQRETWSTRKWLHKQDHQCHQQHQHVIGRHSPQAHGFGLGPQPVALLLRAVGALVGSSLGKWVDRVGLTVYILVPLSVISISGPLSCWLPCVLPP